MNKKIILSLFLVFIVALSVSAASAADDDQVIADGAIDEIGDAPSEIIADEEGGATTTETDADAIKKLIDEAEEGGIINLDEGRTYDVTGTQITIPKKVTIDGHGATIKDSGLKQGGQGSTLIATADGITIKNIKFVNTDGVKEVGTPIDGYAITFAIQNGLVDNCTFIDWSSGVYGRGAAFCTINNCYFNGVWTQITNDGNKEKGTKAINLMGSHDITVTNCVFDGPMLDGISIASNSGNNIMTGNTFIGNAYAIYFGGASTQGCVIADNTFIDCGYNTNSAGEILFDNLPVISTQKAANGYVIKNNIFNMTHGTLPMKAESGNTAHGYPSAIGDISISGNTIIANGDASKVTFVEILSNSGPLSPYAPIAITDNTITEGARLVKVTYANWAELPSSINGQDFSGGVEVWYNAWNATNGVIIPASEKIGSAIQVVDMDTDAGTITVKLIDGYGVAIDKEEIAYTIAGGEEQSGVTEDGLLTINVDKNGLVSFAFAETNKYKGAAAEINFAFSKKLTKLTATAKTYLITAKTKSISATLKDENGVALANKKVTFTVNGKTYSATTNENGVATVKVSLTTAKAYAVSIKYAGEDKYGAASVSSKITVNKVAVKATVPKKTFKKAATTKKVTFTLKTSAGKAIAKKKITFKVNGKTYTATTNAKGVATAKIKITKKGTYTMTSKFAGDKTYKGITKKSKVIIK